MAPAPSHAQEEDALINEVLEGLVDGFTGAAGPNYGNFATPYGEQPEVRVRLQEKMGATKGETDLAMEVEIEDASIYAPTACEERRARAGQREVSLGTQITLINDEEIKLPVNSIWECQLRNNQLVLRDQDVSQATCKSFFWGCSATSP